MWQKLDQNVNEIWPKCDRNWIKTWMTKMWSKFDRNDPEIWSKYGQNATKIWKKLDQNMNEIWSKWNQNLAKIWSKPRCIWFIGEIFLLKKVLTNPTLHVENSSSNIFQSCHMEVQRREPSLDATYVWRHGIHFSLQANEVLNGTKFRASRRRISKRHFR